MLGCCWYSRRITGTLVQGIAPSSVMMTDTYSAGIASYIRFSSAAATAQTVRAPEGSQMKR